MCHRAEAAEAELAALRKRIEDAPIEVARASDDRIDAPANLGGKRVRLLVDDDV